MLFSQFPTTADFRCARNSSQLALGDILYPQSSPFVHHSLRQAHNRAMYGFNIVTTALC